MLSPSITIFNFRAEKKKYNPVPFFPSRESIKFDDAMVTNITKIKSASMFEAVTIEKFDGDKTWNLVVTNITKIKSASMFEAVTIEKFDGDKAWNLVVTNTTKIKSASMFEAVTIEKFDGDKGQLFSLRYKKSHQVEVFVMKASEIIKSLFDTMNDGRRG